MLQRAIGLILMCSSGVVLAADTVPPPIQGTPGLPTIQPPAALAPVAAAPKTTVLPAADKPLSEFDAAPTEPPPQKAQPPLKVDWGDLALFFYISEPKMERRVTTDVLGTASASTYFSFSVRARQRFSNLTIFSGKFYNSAGHEVFSMPLEFQPSRYQWAPGDDARAFLMMPDHLNDVRSLVLGTMF